MKFSSALLVAALGGVSAIGGGWFNPPRTSDGCGTATSVPKGTTQTLSLSSGRTFNVHIPSGYVDSTAHAVVYSFHGYTDTAGNWEATSGMSSVSNDNDFIVVYPEATHFADPRGYYSFISSWNDGACSAGSSDICVSNLWAYPADPNCAITPGPCDWCTCGDDVAFVEDVMDEVNDLFCVDQARVFSTGFSNGGMFTNRLACDLADRLAAVAPVSGTLPPGHTCTAPFGRKVSIMQIASLGDPWVPNTGLVIHPSAGGDTYKYSSIQDVSRQWGKRYLCDPHWDVYTTNVDGDDGWSCSERANCIHGLENVYCLWDGRGHNYPGQGEAVAWGSQTIWEFFVANSPAP